MNKNKKVLTIQEAWIDTGLAKWNENKDGVKFNNTVTYVPSVSDGYLLKTCRMMFATCKELTKVELFDTSNVTNMSFMFAWCLSLKSVPIFTTDKVIDMERMFYKCSSLITVNLFNTSNVINMERMFRGCKKLFIKPVLDMSSVTNKKDMYCGCLLLGYPEEEYTRDY